MFGSAILDTALGLVFVYLLLSLVVSAANEAFSSIRQSRGKNLWQGIQHLLTPAKAIEFYQHPLIKGLTLSPTGRPSYIPSRTFALALLDTISPTTGEPRRFGDLKATVDALPDNHVKKTLLVLLEESDSDVAKFKANIEKWFNESMMRVAGWYKRHTQWTLLAFAALFTISLNIDSTRILSALSQDATVRAAFIAQAESFAKENAAAGEGRQQKLDEAFGRLEKVGIVFGWTDDDKRGSWGMVLGNAVWNHGLGWIVTALAASLGAPFWFDLLNRFINIRSSGKAPEEKPK